MLIRLILLCLVLIMLPISSHAQFIGIKIGIPPTGTPGLGGLGPAGGGGGGGGGGNGNLQDDAVQFTQDDAGHLLQGS